MATFVGYKDIINQVDDAVRCHQILLNNLRLVDKHLVVVVAGEVDVGVEEVVRLGVPLDDRRADDIG